MVPPEDNMVPTTPPRKFLTHDSFGLPLTLMPKELVTHLTLIKSGKNFEREEIVAKERERKARTTLLMAIPEDHLAKFHKMTDAKDMWNAIKSRFGGNDESKKMQKYIFD
ncbi:hypothetical protein Tco_0292356 [Tanacetum coccineum]|uniref:Xylulose kinase-1 n=1 Tax=Tanacetum coccineum TaxID=301880 RepID=A0ABQ5F2H5_9ASTR